MIITSADRLTFAVPSVDAVLEKGVCCSYHILCNGVDRYTGKTADDYRNDGFSVLTGSEFDALVDQHDNAQCGHWKEITEEFYNYALNVLPPMGWYNGGFFNPEAISYDIYDFYQEYNGRFYCSLQRRSTARDEIMIQLTAAISSGTVEDCTPTD